MAPEPGDTVWIPCSVRGSAFADERKVTAIRATIVGTAHGQLAARLPGQTRHREYLAVPETLLT
jgi:hypothetical protein